MPPKTFDRHLIKKNCTIRTALEKLNQLGKDAILFIVNENGQLMGSLTDGDVRRGLLKGYNLDDPADSIVHRDPKYLVKGEKNIDKVIEYRENNLKIVPILNGENQIVNIINFSEIKSYLPVDAVIMAGGRGERLKPLTDDRPKPLLKVGDRTILRHGIDRLRKYGIDDFWITVRYLGEMIENEIGDGKECNIAIKYVYEDEPLGTIGAVSLIQDFRHEYILIINSDLLTNIDLEHFFLDFLTTEADFSVVTIPYQVNIPYAVVETDNGHIIHLKEKPTYTYYSNGGIYLMKKDILEYLPRGRNIDSPDLIELLIKNSKKVLSYPFSGYWLDIGRPEDFQKANNDIKNITF